MQWRSPADEDRGEVVGEGLQVQAELPVPPVPETEQLARLAHRHAVVLPARHAGTTQLKVDWSEVAAIYCESHLTIGTLRPGYVCVLKRCQRVRRGRLENSVAEAELAVAAQPEAVKLAGAGEGDRVVAAARDRAHRFRHAHSSATQQGIKNLRNNGKARLYEILS